VILLAKWTTALTATSSQGALFSRARGVYGAHATNVAEKPSNKCYQNGKDAQVLRFVRCRPVA
jgi:hypothetical protein